jgi:hypothetical protein
MTDDEIWLNYVMISHTTYEGCIKAMQEHDIIREVLMHAPEQAIPNMIRMIMGIETRKEEK